MKKLKKFISLAMVTIMTATSLTIPPVKTEAAIPDKTVLVDDNTIWRYLDNNTDPGDAMNPASWTLSTYDDASWKTGNGSFGAKHGDSKDLGGGFVADNLLNQYIDGTTTDIPAFFFRTTFHIDSLDDLKELTGEIQYDDAAIVYINGVKVASFDVPSGGYPDNMSYGGSNKNYPKTGNFTIENTEVATGPAIVSGSAIEAGSSILVEGENVMAVELHQGRSSSSDIFLKVNRVELVRNGYLDDGFDTMEAEGYSTWSGGELKTENGTDSENGSLVDVGNTYDGAWLEYNDRYFEEAPSFVTFRYVNNSGRCASDSRMEIRLDGADGDLLQTVELPATGSNWNAYAVKTVDLTNPDAYLGKHTLCFVMRGTTTGSNPYIMNLDYIKFSSTPRTISQKAVSLNIGEDETSRNITWYADDAAPGVLQLALKSDMTGEEFPEQNYREFTAGVQSANDPGFYSNQVTMDNLQLDTEYAYRLINKDTVSKVYNFRTMDGGDFSFLFAGDPQIGASGSNTNDSNGWDNTLTQSLNQFPDVDFIVSAGDQVNSAADESQYAGYLNHEALTTMPFATVVGNHDTASSSYKQHFNNPNVSSYGATAAGSDYWYVYNDVLFLNLNSNNLSTAEHKAFLEEAISTNPDAAWKIVIFHHSIYSVANHATENDIIQRRNDYSPIFKDLGIDVVLMGHDHVYVRSYMMDGMDPQVVRNSDNSPLSSVTDPDGILYVTANSASGSKFYTIKSQVFPYSAVQSQEHKANISNVKITPASFKITTYRVHDMSVVDTFEIIHSKALTGVVNPENITGLKNGTAKTAQALGLPQTVRLTTDNETMDADVQWDTASSTYDPAVKKEQTFTVNGTVSLPDGVSNPENLSLEVSITVTVSKMAEEEKVLISIKEPAAVTGIKNGVAKTPEALKLPQSVTLVTNQGEEPAQVNWDTASSTYEPSVRTAQTFTVAGTVILPEDVVNTDNIDLSITIQVNVDKKRSSGSNSSGKNDHSKESTLGDNKDNGTDSQKQAAVPIAENVSARAAVDKSGHATAAVSETAVTNAIEKAVSAAREQGQSAAGIEISVAVNTPDTADSMGIVLTHNTLNKIAENQVQKFKVDGSLATLNFDKNAIEEIRKQSMGDVNIDINPVQKLSEEAKEVMKDRQVYDINLTYGKGKKTQSITKLGQGVVTIGIPYTPAKGEDTGKLFAAYVDESGKVDLLTGSSYDTNTSSVIFTTSHFSVYGIAYQEKAVNYTDIADHPAKESIDFITSRGILEGTDKNTFGPNTALTYGTLAKALAVLDEADTGKYTESSFKDLENNQYKQYIEWAYQKGIVAGRNKEIFAPERTLNRKQLAVILEKYAKAAGFALPKTRDAINFTDDWKISFDDSAAVFAVQQAGIMDKEMNNQFNPLKTVTNGEAALILQRYVKLTINPQTAQGWALNDSFQKIYYKDGKVLIGWQNLGNNWYYFKSDGSLAADTFIGAYYVDKNGVRVNP